ncbi:MAG TPA: TatD family hydrolase [Desulfuromonadaceae bacterium]|jgi:TatD DNase family protein
MQTNVGYELIDSHCHLDLEPLHSNLCNVLKNARQTGVTRFVLPGVHPDGWDRIADLAKKENSILPAFGIHPSHAGLADDVVLKQLEKLAKMASAIGEIGLDPFYQVPLEVQEMAFRKQLRLAVFWGLPVLIHCRRLFQRTLQLLKEEQVGQVGGLMHSFSGSVEMALEFIRLGFCISISGTVTWQGAVRPVSLARELPLESLVLETDAPDLSPQIYKGQPNQPAFLPEVLQTVARIRGVDPEELARQTSLNILKLLKKRTEFDIS